ncbi:MAG TPA: ABC transporter substrate-binding protein [Thermoanaerobaculia bacterium]
MRRRLLALVVSVAALAACHRETVRPVVRRAAAPAVSDGGRVAVRLESEPSTLNYLLQTTDDEKIFFSFLYDPLIDLDRSLAPIPGTAASWEIQNGGKTYILHLDPRATFSDGTPVTARDVVFTLNKAIEADSMAFAANFEGLDRAQTAALDEHTVRVVFKEARVTQLLAFNIGVMPEHVYAKGDFAKPAKLVGNGAYVVERRQPGRSILLKRRADYWRAQPHIESLLLRVVPDDAVAWKSVLRGELDIARISNEQWFRVKDDPKVRELVDFRNVYLLSYNCVLWNLSDPLFDDARVRRALAMSFDRQAVIDRLYHGQARAVSGPFLPDQWANNPEIVPIERNPEAAAALLSSAGWRDSDGDGVLDRGGKRFAFRILVPANSSTAKDQCQVLQDALSKLGVKMEINALDEAAYFDQITKRNYQAAFTAWSNEPDPDPYSLFHSSQVPPEGFNVVGYKNAEADALIEQARAEFDRGRRADLYHQLHEVLSRDQPYLWTVQVGSKWAVSRRVEHVEASSGLGLFLWNPGPRSWSVRQ